MRSRKRVGPWAAGLALCAATVAVALPQVAGAAARRAAPRTTSAAAHVTVWLPYWAMTSALGSTLTNAATIGTASPYWYTIKGTSKVELAEDPSGAGGVSPSAVSQLTGSGVQVVPMVTEDDGMAAFAKLVASSTQRAAMVKALVGIASHTGYSGLDLDFETLSYNPKHNRALADQVAAGYPQLVAQVCGALDAINRSCEVTVMPRTTPAHVWQHGDIATWVYDYGALARAADRIQIMAYDDHSPGGASGPIAPLPWVRSVIAYARSVSPPASDELGVPAYGYDWYTPTSATAVLANQAAGLARKVHARIRWNATQGENTFTYKVHGTRHTVWYEGSQSDVQRARLASAAGFAGIAIWAGGYAAPNLWQQLQSIGE
ncbi:MAG: glycosyl hydrolase family 18 protein [Conexibacteraceae bacterium]|nr:glycosyl hydrolase family 18 protein [Conexibacteraceae bacterium]